MNLALKEHETQLITTCHQWNNNDVFPFPKRIMPECQLLYGCINKAGEGASKGEKIFQITNAMKFHAKRELPVKWLHTIGTGHKCGQKGCGTGIAGQFMHRHQATDTIAPWKAPESFAVKRAQLPPKTFLFRYSFRLITL